MLLLPLLLLSDEDDAVVVALVKLSLTNADAAAFATNVAVGRTATAGGPWSSRRLPAGAAFVVVAIDEGGCAARKPLMCCSFWGSSRRLSLKSDDDVSRVPLLVLLLLLLLLVAFPLGPDVASEVFFPLDDDGDLLSVSAAPDFLRAARKTRFMMGTVFVRCCRGGVIGILHKNYNPSGSLY